MQLSLQILVLGTSPIFLGVGVQKQNFSMVPVGIFTFITVTRRQWICQPTLPTIQLHSHGGDSSTRTGDSRLDASHHFSLLSPACLLRGLYVLPLFFSLFNGLLGTNYVRMY